MNENAVDQDAARLDILDRLLGLFSEVHPGEGRRALLMLLNVFLILVSYYIIKTVREPLILNAEVPRFLQALGIKSPAEVKTFAAAGQTLVLMAFVPAYSWIASHVSRMKLIAGITLFFVANILAFAVAVNAEFPYVGVIFYIWVGLFSLSIIAQFWSYGNDIYTRDAGNRLFPIIGIGAIVGSPVGAWIARQLFHAQVSPHLMLLLAAALLSITLAFYLAINRNVVNPNGAAAPVPQEPLGPGNAFRLVFASRYILLIATLLIVLNVVNTVGEYILSDLVVIRASELAAADGAFDRVAWIGAFYGSYFFWVNVIAVFLQAFVASRLLKRFGLAGVLLVLPVIALGAYGFIAIGATLLIVRWAKTAENSIDYSLMNTAKQLLWLPTTREEKYKAKQAVDSFFVRLGDVFAAFVVFAGTAWLALDTSGFAMVNLGFIVVWLMLAWLLVKRNRQLTA
jgi:AAA family ATP:ADP antiporter